MKRKHFEKSDQIYALKPKSELHVIKCLPDRSACRGSMVACSTGSSAFRIFTFQASFPELVLWGLRFSREDLGHSLWIARHDGSSARAFLSGVVRARSGSTPPWTPRDGRARTRQRTSAVWPREHPKTPETRENTLNCGVLASSGFHQKNEKLLCVVFFFRFTVFLSRSVSKFHVAW